ncbi:hypothetical protein M422DRAFT_119477, partial [Sphaerobolus stellatus SS14]
LGIRSPEYQPVMTDYQAYILLRNIFLRSPRGRLALLSGGILWRLAIEVIGDDAVLGFPSEKDMYIEDIILSTERTCYGRERLTNDEIDLICGV